MLELDIAPLAVVRYGKDFLIDFIRFKTGWDQRGLVSDKNQLNYLCRYLEDSGVNAKTIVVENEYVDRHYLEDYSEYYARCFFEHPRKCSRLHFFAVEFDQVKFTKALAENDSSFLEGLRSRYLGNAVIRPIPHTFLARLCLRPFKHLVSEDPSYKLISKCDDVSLFGLKLSIDTIPFLEQDKVVSACATSAVWTMLHAAGSTKAEHLPSPSAITKAATGFHSDTGRTFPTSGLTLPQVAKALKHFALEPTIFNLARSDHVATLLQEYIYAFVSNDIPVLIGGDVYEIPSRGKTCKLRGKHFVCALGYQLGAVEKEVTGRSGPPLKSHRVQKFYVHDDRYGPYIRLEAKLQGFNGMTDVDAPDKSKVARLSGLALTIDGEHKDWFVPDVLVIGHYHKIRITYAHVRDVSEALYRYLTASREALKVALKKDKLANTEKRRFFENVLQSFGHVLDAEWDISLATSNNLKNAVLRGEGGSVSAFNGSLGRTPFLLHSCPKFIWRCRISSRRSNNQSEHACITDLLFDATEVPQGSLLIGYLSYGEHARYLWPYVEQQIKDRAWEKYDLGKTYRQAVNCIIKFFSAVEGKTYLNTLYGPLRVPTRELKYGEVDARSNITRRNDVMIARRGAASLKESHFEKTKKYIWVIDALGDLVIGEDIEDAIDGFNGHPTLIDGRPARLGGELAYSEEGGKWELRLKSRAYSSHLETGSAEAYRYLQNVMDNNFHEFGQIAMAFDELPRIGSTGTAKTESAPKLASPKGLSPKKASSIGTPEKKRSPKEHSIKVRRRNGRKV